MERATPKPPAGVKSNKEDILTCILKRVDMEKKSISLMQSKTAEIFLSFKFLFLTF